MGVGVQNRLTEVSKIKIKITLSGPWHFKHLEKMNTGSTDFLLMRPGMQRGYISFTTSWILILAEVHIFSEVRVEGVFAKCICFLTGLTTPCWYVPMRIKCHKNLKAGFKENAEKVKLVYFSIRALIIFHVSYKRWNFGCQKVKYGADLE